MSQDRPAIDDILSIVQQFLDGAGDSLDGDKRYNAQVARYLLAICEREMRLGPALDAAERQRLAAFLGVDGTLAALNQRLAADIRAGHLDDRWTQTLDLVLSQVVDKVTVVRPERLDPMHRR